MRKLFILLMVTVSLLTVFTGCSDYQIDEVRKVSEYEVVSVFQYAEARTNRFGGVTGTSIYYSFNYLDNDGKIKTVNDFENLEYGLTKICLGDSDRYVIEQRAFDTYQYLYLTRNTLERIQKNE